MYSENRAPNRRHPRMLRVASILALLLGVTCLLPPRADPQAAEARGGWRKMYLCAVGVGIHVLGMTNPPPTAGAATWLGLQLMRTCG